MTVTKGGCRRILCVHLIVPVMGLVSTARAAVTWDGTVQIALCRCPAQAAAVGTERVRLVIALAIPTGPATIAATCLTVQDSCRNLASTAPGMVFALAVIVRVSFSGVASIVAFKGASTLAAAMEFAETAPVNVLSVLLVRTAAWGRTVVNAQVNAQVMERVL